jgi:hypothetical protein
MLCSRAAAARLAADDKQVLSCHVSTMNWTVSPGFRRVRPICITTTHAHQVLDHLAKACNLQVSGRVLADGISATIAVHREASLCYDMMSGQGSVPCVADACSAKLLLSLWNFTVGCGVVLLPILGFVLR